MELSALNKNLYILEDEKLRDLLSGYILFLSLRKSPNTLRAYKMDLFCALDPATTWEELNSPNKKFWRKYISGRQDSGLKFFGRALAAWKGFFKFCQDQGEEIKSGILRIKPVKVRSKLFYIPLPEEICTYIESCDHQDWISQRNLALLLLLYSSGMRISEALGIKNWSQTASLRICGKGGKVRDLPILQIAQDAIALYKQLCPFNTGEMLFVGKDGTPLTYSSVYKFVRKTPWGSGFHGLRRSATTHMLRAGADLESVRLLLGHSSLATTQRYVINDFQHLHEVFKKASKKQ